jgi:hypothetical protein
MTFFALGPLGLVGMALAAGKANRCRYLYLQVLTNLFALVLFWPVGRFRLPMAAAMVPFAALTVVRVAQWVVERRTLRAVVAACAIAGIWLSTGRPLPTDSPPIRSADYLVPYRVYYTPMINEAAEAGKWQQAADVLAESLRYEPDSVRQMGSGYLPRTPDEAKLGEYYSQLREYYAGLLLRAGHAPAAASQHRRATEIRKAVQQAAAPGREPGKARTN